MELNLKLWLELADDYTHMNLGKSRIKGPQTLKRWRMWRKELFIGFIIKENTSPFPTFRYVISNPSLDLGNYKREGKRMVYQRDWKPNNQGVFPSLQEAANALKLEFQKRINYILNE